MSDAICPFGPDDVKICQRQRLYDGFFKIDGFTLKHRLFDGGWSGEIQRELFERGESAGVLLFDPDTERLALLQQFRIGALNEATGPWLLELVAGVVETGHRPDDTVRREALEEANVEVQALHPICRYLVSPGGTSEVMHLFCACADLTDVGGIYGLEDEGEDIRVITLPWQEVKELLADGRINNAATIIALQWLELHRSELASELTSELT